MMNRAYAWLVTALAIDIPTLHPWALALLAGQDESEVASLTQTQARASQARASARFGEMRTRTRSAGTPGGAG